MPSCTISQSGLCAHRPSAGQVGHGTQDAGRRPERARRGQTYHLAETADVLDAHRERVVDLLLGGEPADAEPNRRVRHVFLDPERTEHI